MSVDMAIGIFTWYAWPFDGDCTALLGILSLCLKSCDIVEEHVIEQVEHELDRHQVQHGRWHACLARDGIAQAQLQHRVHGSAMLVGGTLVVDLWLPGARLEQRLAQELELRRHELLHLLIAAREVESFLPVAAKVLLGPVDAIVAIEKAQKVGQVLVGVRA